MQCRRPASALAQIGNLNSELAAAMVERFKLVATVHGEKRRYSQKTSFWEDKVKSAEAKTANQEMCVKHSKRFGGSSTRASRFWRHCAKPSARLQNEK